MKENEATDMPDLTQPDEFSDVTLMVEDRKLYTCKAVLASASPVWRRMFSSDFKERNINEIPLPGKSFDDILELLLCITPATMKRITGDTVFRILPLTEEYQIQTLKNYCEQYLLQELRRGKLSDNDKVKCANLAQTYGLEKLLEKTTQALSKLSVAALEKCKEYEDIEPGPMVNILKPRLIEQEICVLALETRVRKLETRLLAQGSSLNEHESRLCKQAAKLTRIRDLATCNCHGLSRRCSQEYSLVSHKSLKKIEELKSRCLRHSRSKRS